MRELRDREAVAASSITSWDYEVDVAVVGLGCAGVAAAIEASESGARVLAIERTSGGGGTSANSGGLIYLGGGTAVQKACGIEDTAEDMFRFLMASCGPGPDEAKIRIFADRSVELFDWLESHGVPFKRSTYPEPGKEPPTDDCLVYSGGEDGWPYEEIAKPAPRAHKAQTPGAGGGFLMQKLLEALGRTSAELLEDARVDRLVVDEVGCVVGLVAHRVEGDVCVRAAGGVVLTAGGFISNPEMIERYAPQVAKANYKVGTENDDGSGILLAMAVGADAIRMDAASITIPLYPPKNICKGVLVNQRGQRFLNEDAYAGLIGQRALREQEGRCWHLVDAETYVVNEAFMEAKVVEESWEALEQALDLPAGALVATMELYNRHARDGKDPVFHKRDSLVVPLDKPPFGAINVTTRGCVYAAFTLGGLHTLPSGEVLRPDGSAVEGVYAAGRTTSGIAADGYVSGVSLGDGLMFGRLAGATAAARGAHGNDSGRTK
ncbi:MAG: FAD-dependent oxidoreductase [Candidatus Binatia bacterium]|nr:FAD-dependent oxidoreductase [Candidatus Binatia bacterium]